MKEQRCPNCHKHCLKEHLHCDRGRQYFAVQINGEDALLQVLNELQIKFEASTEKSKFFDCLTACEKTILTTILQKVKNDKK